MDEPREITHVTPTPACPRCGSHVGVGVTHVCPMPSTSSAIVPGGSIQIPLPAGGDTTNG